MGQGILTRYSASAGSGKTYELAAIYLNALFTDPLSYRNILAVTFTNKATAEMKERILNNLYLLSQGRESEYSELVLQTTGKSRERIISDASFILSQLLHDYSRFSVGTIDSFFQKVLRSFARESGLQAGFNIILDSTMILMQSVDELLKDAEHDRELLKWLTEFAQREIIDGRSWNLKRKILSLGEEIFKEKYRLLHEEGFIQEDKQQLGEAIKGLYIWQEQFKRQISELSAKAIEILDFYSVEDEMLFNKSRSIRKFLDIAINEIPEVSLKALYAASDEGRYNSGTIVAEELEAAISGGLDDIIKNIASAYRSNITLYHSVRLVLDNLYTLGILNDIASKTRKILTEQNKFLLSDAGDILRKIIGKDQAPFIYEKMGNRYSNFMIDEFQDTSRVQWYNFLPLISNSISEGNNSLVVGDVKQSIYRWRNSDWEIFENIDKQFHPDSFKTRSLNRNYRSTPNIIAFNNRVFSELPALVEENLGLKKKVVSDVYSNVVQESPGIYSGGYVRMKLYDSLDEGKNDALKDLPALIEEIQDNGYSPGDIGILVRTGREGQNVINRITAYASESGRADSKYSYRVISQDSLMLSNSPVINFLVSVLKYLVDREDDINRTIMYQNYLLSFGDDKVERPLFISRDKYSIPGRQGTGFDDFLDTIRYLSVYEIIDRIIDFTELNNINSALPYLNTLQNNVLEFAGTDTNDIPAFLEWWDNEGRKRSVSSTEQSDAMQLMTIHKSKGLQFKVVILPFISWTFTHEIRPVLWVYSKEKLLSGLGAIPVRMNKGFEGTYYEDFYSDELGKAAVDKLNLLYVAFTRARECLYGNMLCGKRGKTAGMYLQELFSAEEKGEGVHMSSYWDSENNVFSFGEVPGQKPVIHDEKISMEIHYPLVMSDDRLRMKLHSKTYYKDMRDEGTNRRQYGLLMHEILSSIKTAKDIEGAVSFYLGRGIINREEYEMIGEALVKAINQDEVISWFSEDIKVKNEKDIIIPGGDIRRPDRIVFRDDRVILIDFKFGDELPSHRKQIDGYRMLLKEMGYENVEACIWYFESSKVIRV